MTNGPNFIDDFINPFTQNTIKQWNNKFNFVVQDSDLRS